MSEEATMWYGLCGYWTADWSKLSRSGNGIPTCPGCGAPGFTATVTEWWRNVDTYEREDQKGISHPGYRASIEATEGQCPKAKPHE